MNWLQQVVDGITSGSIYGALALALVLVFRSTGLINFSQGQMAALSAYFVYAFLAAGIPIWAGFLLAIVASAVVGAVLERVLVRRFEGGDPLVTISVTVALLICLNGVVTWIWGADLKPFPGVFPAKNLAAGGLHFTLADVGNVIVLVLVILLIQALFRGTRLGLSLRAVAANPESSAQSGLPVGRLLMIGWGLAAMVGAIAGVLVAPKISLTPNMMDQVLVYALAAAILGGLESPIGAVVAAWIIGIVQNLAGSHISFIGADLQIVVPLVLMAVVLLVRPQGLFGRKTVSRV